MQALGAAMGHLIPLRAGGAQGHTSMETHMGSPLSMYSQRSSSDSSENFTIVSSWNSEMLVSSWPSARTEPPGEGMQPVSPHWGLCTLGK